mmetsp:Transcript_104454/g.196689  ORF Transcript_104454/g.196689 Transcript_104454/m.196689 type:complete len:345 (-) Transcript_104454:118-1152(-)
MADVEAAHMPDKYCATDLPCGKSLLVEEAPMHDKCCAADLPCGRSLEEIHMHDSGCTKDLPCSNTAQDLPDKYSLKDLPCGKSLQEIRSSLHIVSLGSTCFTKLTVRRLGLSDVTLPFDWIRCRMEGLLHFLANDFEDFFNFADKQEVILHDHPMTAYRSPMHSFWHDKLEDYAVRANIWKRVHRFLNLAIEDSRGSLLFVRTVATTAELSEIEHLFELLQTRRGNKQIYLLVVIGGQAVIGPILHAKHTGIIFWAQPEFEQLTTSMDREQPYEDAILFGVHYVLGDAGADFGSYKFNDIPSVTAASELVDEGGLLQESHRGLWMGYASVAEIEEPVMLSAFSE